jgi:hypothetical protein
MSKDLQVANPYALPDGAASLDDRLPARTSLDPAPELDELERRAWRAFLTDA